MSSAFENAMNDLQANNYTQQYPVTPFWMRDYEAIKAKQQETQRILDRRAAAGLLDSDAAAATMTEARQSIAASAEAMEQDFSAANDAALFDADQYDDMMQWRWSIGDLGM